MMNRSRRFLLAIGNRKDPIPSCSDVRAWVLRLVNSVSGARAKAREALPGSDSATAVRYAVSECVK
jgi:hypothetical protein